MIYEFILCRFVLFNWKSVENLLFILFILRLFYAKFRSIAGFGSFLIISRKGIDINKQQKGNIKQVIQYSAD